MNTNLIEIIAREMDRLGYGHHESHAESILHAIRSATPIAIKRYDFDTDEACTRVRFGEMADGAYVSFDDALSQLAALREELSLKLEAYQGAHMMVTDLKAELAALREKLAQAAHMRTFWAESAAELDKRLTAAEQRNSERDELLRIIHKDYRDDIGSALWELIDAALQPTESGASE